MICIQNDKEANVYAELENELRESILSGGIKYDKPILGEFELAREYNISRKSVRKALNNLTNQGLIKKFKAKAHLSYPPGRESECLQACL